VHTPVSLSEVDIPVSVPDVVVPTVGSIVASVAEPDPVPETVSVALPLTVSVALAVSVFVFVFVLTLPIEPLSLPVAASSPLHPRPRIANALTP